MTLIREARDGDLDVLIEMGEQFYQQTAYIDITTYDPDSVRKTVIELMESDRGIVIVADDDGKILGMVGAILYPLYLNNNHLTGQELFWWMDPDKRSTRVGMEMLKTMELVAKNRGADSFMMMSLDKLSPEKLDQVYQRRGYVRSEHTYIRRL